MKSSLIVDKFGVPFGTSGNPFTIGGVITSLGIDGTLPHVSGYIQNPTAGNGVLATIGSQPVGGNFPIGKVYFPFVDGRGYNNLIVWMEGLTQAAGGLYVSQVYDTNLLYGWTRGGAASNIPSGLNSTAQPLGDNGAIFWFQEPLGFGSLGIDPSVAGSYTGIGVYLTR